MSDEPEVSPFIRWMLDAGLEPPGGRPTAVPDTSGWKTADRGDPRGIRYVQAALDSAAAGIAAMLPDSGRNHALFVASARMGNFVAGGWIDEAVVRAALEAAALAAQLPGDETLRTLESGLTKGKRSPEDPKLRPREPYNPFGDIPGGDSILVLRRGNPPTPPPGSPGDSSGGGGTAGNQGRPRREHRVVNPVESFYWLLTELGQNGLAGMFRRGPSVVHTSQINEEGYTVPPRKGDDNGPATLHEVTPARLTAELALSYLVHRVMVPKPPPKPRGRPKTKAEGEPGSEEKPEGKPEEKPDSEPEPPAPMPVKVPVFFPRDAVSNALAAAADRAPNLRLLRGVTHTPMVRKDGSILDQPGYDIGTGFLYLPTVDVPTVPEHPDAEQLAEATRLLRGMVDEFKWGGFNDEANFLGLLLTPLLRELCPPPYKLGAIMARQPGSGKSLLAEIIRNVHGGVFRSELPHDDAEMGKSLTGILSCTTAAVVQFDNVGGVVRSSRLAGLLTSAVYSDRVLGSTNSIDMPNDRMWLLTGNNLAFGGDLVRRTIWITIDPGVPEPHLRPPFRLHLPSYVVDNRGDILRALLIWVRAWSDAGAHAEKRGSDSYTDWLATVRAILAHADVPGEFDHADSQQQRIGTDDEGWGEFLAVLHGVFKGEAFMVRTVIERMSDTEGKDDHPTEMAQKIIDALPAELYEKLMKARTHPRAIAKSLGRWFMNRNGRWSGMFVAERDGEHPEYHVAQWKTREMGTTK